MERTPTRRAQPGRVALAEHPLNEGKVSAQESDGLLAMGALATEGTHEIDSSLSQVIGNIDFALQCLARLSVAYHAPLELQAAQRALREARRGSARLRNASRKLSRVAAKQPKVPALIEVQHVTGSAFEVPLATKSAMERREPHTAPSQPTLPRLRILVIDDEPHLLTLVRRLLREHEVTGFRDARQALRLLTDDPGFDVIFCDVMMPAMSGADFHAALSLALPELVSRLVFVTGGVFGGKARQFLRMVSNEVIGKPFAVETLRGAIARVTGETERALRGQ